MANLDQVIFVFSIRKPEPYKGKGIRYDGEQQVRQVVPGAERDDPGAQRNRRVTFTIDATQRQGEPVQPDDEGPFLAVPVGLALGVLQ